MKWISLLIWAGADPLSKGEADPNSQIEVDPEYEGLSALGYAALYDHYEVFDLKQIKLPADHPAMQQLLGYCSSRPGGVELFERLLDLGVHPNDQENGGCSVIQQLIGRLEWGVRHRIYSWELDEDGLDSQFGFVMQSSRMPRGMRWPRNQDDRCKSLHRRVARST